jgi:hypothetical protein
VPNKHFALRKTYDLSGINLVLQGFKLEPQNPRERWRFFVRAIYQGFRNLKLFQKILLIVFGLTLPVVILASWFVVNEFIRVTKVNAGVRLQGLAFNAADKIDRNMFERYGDVQAFAVSKQATSLYVDEIVPWMNTMTKIYAPNYSLMVMANLSGKIIATNTIKADGTAKQFGAWSKCGQSKLVSSGSHRKNPPRLEPGDRFTPRTVGGSRLRRSERFGDVLYRPSARWDWRSDRGLDQLF